MDRIFLQTCLMILLAYFEGKKMLLNVGNKTKIAPDVLTFIICVGVSELSKATYHIVTSTDLYTTEFT